MLRLYSSLLILGWCASSPLLAQEGVLQEVRDQVNRPAEPSTDSPKRREKPCGGDDGCGDDCSGQLILAVVALPFALPYVALGDDFGRNGSFSRYPYPDDFPGYVWLGRSPGQPAEEASPPASPPGLREWSGRLSLEDGNDFRGLNRLGGSLVFDTASRFGLRASWNYFHEDFDGGRTDQTFLGDTNLTFRFAQSERVQFYAGLGCRMLTDPHTTNFGFNFTYGADFFPVRPVFVSAGIDLGNLGSATVVHARGTVGITWKRYEIYTGYDYLRIGTVSLQGPLAGLRFWF